MAEGISKSHCVKCEKERSTSKCGGCSQDFCCNHLIDHHQELHKQLDEIEVHRDIFRETLNEQTNNLKKNLLIKQIDQWEEDSINKIQQIAKECRQILFQHTTKHINQIEVNLTDLTDQIRLNRKENDFNEINLRRFQEKLTKLSKELDQPSNVSIQQDFEPFISKISVVASAQPFGKTYDGVWVEAEDGKIPLDAVVGGREGNRHVYVVRFKTLEGNMIPGKLVEMSKIAQGPYHGVRTSSIYQVLTNSDPNRKLKWVTTKGNNIPEGAFLAGKEEQINLYVARVSHSSDSILVGKYHTLGGRLYITHEGKEKHVDNNFEVLCIS